MFNAKKFISEALKLHTKKIHMNWVCYSNLADGTDNVYGILLQL